MIDEYFLVDGKRFVLETPGKILAYVLPNRLLTPAFYFYTSGNVPDTRGILGGSRAANCGRTKLTAELQDLIFYENFKLAYGIPFEEADDWDQAHAINDFVYLLGYKLAFVNDAGAQTRKVPIANLNMTADWPEANQITFPGIIELEQDKDFTILGRANQVPFYTINGQDPNVKNIKPLDNPYLWKRPAIVKFRQLNGGIEGTEPFGQFNNTATLRWPTLSNGTNVGFIERRLIRVLKPGELMPTWFTKDWGR
jgi:hypothetical protein